MPDFRDTADGALLDRFAAIVSARHCLTAAADVQPFSVEWRDLYHGRPLAVLRPGSTEEVAAVLRLADATRTPIVPQGGNTGLVGAQVPDESGREIVLSLARLDRIREVDADGATACVEAGVVLKRLQEAAEEAGLLFPLSLGSEGSARIGGLISTNAGGTGVLAYGNMRDLVLGLEVALASGEIWNGLRRLKKDNTGYDLKHLFIGAEGTLGIITAAVVKLFPAPRGRAVAFAGTNGPDAALAFFRVLRQRAGASLTAFELMPRIGLDFVLRHASGARDPLASAHPWYVLVEVSSGQSEGEAGALLEAALGAGLEAGLIADAALAANRAQAGAFWSLRHLLSEVQKREGGSIKHDVSVPVAAIPALIDRAAAAVLHLIPGARPVPFGHLGDGNIHFNVTQPKGADKAAFLSRWEDVNRLVHGIVADLGGSISAEHGIGRLKRDLLREVKNPLELDLMRRVKSVLDSNGILSPGRVL